MWCSRQTGKIWSLLRLDSFFFNLDGMWSPRNVNSGWNIEHFRQLWHFYWAVTFDLSDSISLKHWNCKIFNIWYTIRSTPFVINPHVNSKYSSSQMVLSHVARERQAAERNPLDLRPVRSCDRSDSSSSWQQVLYLLLPMIEQPFKKKWFICPHMAGDEGGAALSAATMTFLLSFTAPGASYFLPLVLLQRRYAFIKGKRPKSSLAPKLKVGMPEHIFALACRLPCMHVCAHVQFVLILNSALSSVRAMDPANKATDASTTPSPRYYSCCMVSVWSHLRSLRACRDLCTNSIDAVSLRLPNFRQCSQFCYTRVCLFVWHVSAIFKQRLVYSGKRFKSWTVTLTLLIVGA